MSDIEVQDISPAAWIIKNGFVNEKGDLLQFDQRPFLIDILQDLNPNQVLKKCAQVGASVVFSLKSFFCAKLGLTVIYTMPSDSDVWEFATTKADKIFQYNQELRKYLKLDNATLKQIGNTFIHYKGTRSKTAPISTTTDILIHDETDRSDPYIIEQYQSRLGASQYRGTWYLSNPSSTKRGVDLLFDESDRKEWYITCPSCKTEQKLTYEANIDEIQKRYVCSSCNETLTNKTRLLGHWKAENPGHWRSGYHISQLMAPWITAANLVELKRTKTEEYFRNFVLGEAYSVGETVSFRQAITDCWTTKEITRKPYFMGIDVGKTKHFVLGSLEGIFKIGKIESREEVETLIERYDPTVVMDAGPERTWAEEFKKKYPKLFLCFYNPKDKKKSEIAVWGGDKGTKEDLKNWGYVWADRTRSIDHSLNKIVTGETLFSLTREALEEYTQHWESMRRVSSEEVTRTQGAVARIPIFSWESSTGVDHFCHATVYYDLARSRFSGLPTEIVADREKPAAVIIPSEDGGQKMIDMEEYFGSEGRL